jgi:hypothetical protein
MNLQARVKRLLGKAPEFARKGAQVRAHHREREKQLQQGQAWDEWKITNEPWLQRAQQVLERFFELIDAADDLLDSPGFLTEAQQMRREESLAWCEAQGREGQRPWYNGCPQAWLDGLLEDGRSRLPEDLTPELMARLLAVPLGACGQMDQMDVVCVACGLQLPRQQAAPYSPAPTSGFFDCCPHCGGTAMEWSILVGRQDFAWKALPGFVGRRPL